MKRYELLVDGFHTPLTGAQIAELYRAGRLRRSDPCREVGAERWRTLDELFPLLKYDSTHSAVAVASDQKSPVGLTRRDYNNDAEPLPASTSALKAGWICFGVGLAVSWFFPLGNAFFGVALITAAVAMCTHQVNRGLALLISSLCGIILCGVMFFTLAVGTVAVAGAAAADKLRADVQRQRIAQQQAFGRLNTSATQLQAAMQSIAPAAPPTHYARSAPLNLASISPLARSRPTMPQANAPQVQTARTTASAVQQANTPRERIVAKQQRIEQLERSITNVDHLIQQIRGYGGNESLFVKQRDELVREKWDLQR